MGKGTHIEWATHTFNPWWGCTRVSQGCVHCYAERLAARFGVAWGPEAKRRTMGAAYWKQPHAWDRAAARAGAPARVFCASMADICDPAAPEGETGRLFETIRQTPHLWWLLLTKRPERFRDILPADWGAGYPNVMLMTTIEHEDTQHRMDTLLSTPATLRGLSCEPLLGEVSLCLAPDARERLHWVIVGGESGAGARPMAPGWAYDLKQQCEDARIAFFFKQWGEYMPNSERAAHGAHTRLPPLYKLTGEDVDGAWFLRVGKERAGAFLGGREYRDVPAAMLSFPVQEG